MSITRFGRCVHFTGAEDSRRKKGPISTDQVQLLRRLVLNESAAVNALMSGEIARHGTFDPRTAALVRIAILLGIDSDPATFQWAVELAVAAGVDDADIFDTLVTAAPIIGVARLNSALPHLMTALDLEIVVGVTVSTGE